MWLLLIYTKIVLDVIKSYSYSTKFMPKYIAYSGAYIKNEIVNYNLHFMTMWVPTGSIFICINCYLFIIWNVKKI